MARKPNRPTKAYRPRGIFAVSEKKAKSRLPSLLEFLNPLSMPPGEVDAGKQGPTWGEVIVPPESTSPPNSRLPGLLEFLNPFSAPPGETPAAEPIGYRGINPMGGPQPYRNDVPSSRLPRTQSLPPGWQPPPNQAEIARRLLELKKRPPGKPPAYRRPAPLNYRLNPPSGSWRDIET